MALTNVPERKWRAIATLEHRSLQDWRQRYYPSLTLEGALTREVNFYEVTASAKPGGKLSVTVAIVARKAFECNVDYFSLQRTPKGWVEEVQTSNGQLQGDALPGKD